MKETSSSDAPRSPIPFEELLSAYHDGELSPQEREAVERQIAGSVDARQQLQEFQRISGLLHDLPQPQLPQEFSRHVLRQAEQEMLIPRLRGTMPVSRRKWPLYVVGLTASAAALLVAVFLATRANPPQDGNVQIASTDVRSTSSPQTAAAPQISPSRVGVENFSANPGDAHPGKEVADMRADFAMKTGSSRLVATSTQAIPKDGLSSPLASNSIASPKLSHEQGYSLPGVLKNRLHVESGAMSESIAGASAPVPLTDLKLGQFVSMVRGSGKPGLVLQVVMVDLREGRDAVWQVVEGLAPNADGLPEKSKQRRESQSEEPAPVAEESANVSQGILLQTTTDQLETIVKRLLNEETAVAELQVYQPMELADLESSVALSTATLQSRERVANPAETEVAELKRNLAGKSAAKSPSPKPEFIHDTDANPEVKKTDRKPASIDLDDQPATPGARSKPVQASDAKSDLSFGIAGRGAKSLAKQPSGGASSRMAKTQPQSTPSAPAKAESVATSNRPRLVQIDRRFLERNSGIGSMRRQSTKRLIEHVESDDLLKNSKPTSNAPTADVAVAHAPAPPSVSSPIHVLFVLRQQAPALPIEKAAGAKTPSAKARRP